jgi:mannose-6-phosphate isomerase-like protein (cupin superfamily)
MPNPDDRNPAAAMLRDAFAALRLCPCEPEAFKIREEWSAFEVRDLGIAGETDGRIGAFHMRATGPCRGEQGWHYHALDFHMVYILKGRVKYLWHGSDEPVVAEAGTCLFQPPGGAHNVIDYSVDVEVLEITMPAEYETVPVDPSTTLTADDT